MNQVRIPRYVDDQLSLFMWDFDEFIILIAIFGLGILVGYAIMGLMCAWWTAAQYKKTKGNYLNGRLEQLAFYYGVFSLNKKFEHGGKERVYRK